MPRWICVSLMAALVLLVCVLVLPHPMTTSDGPAHLAFADGIATMGQAGHPLQEQAYRVSLRPNPNLAVYLLMAGLIRLFSPGVAESLVQVLCLVTPMLAGFFALRMIAPGNAWLAVLILPLSVNQMFFLGLYNHCLSTAAFFVAIGAFSWMRKAPSYGRAIWVAAALVLTFLCHASGFIMAWAGVGTLTAALLVLSLRRGMRLRGALWEQRFALVGLLLPLPLAALFLASNGKGVTHYGVGVGARVKQFVTLDEVAANLPSDRSLGYALGAILLTAFVVASLRIVSKRRLESPEREDEALATLAAAVVSVAIMMIFPDTMGGGWTHFRRFELFPYFWGLVLVAYNTVPRPAAVGLLATGAVTGLALLFSMADRQRLVRKQMTPMLEVDRRVASHCAVLPIIVKEKPVDASGLPVAMRYGPYFQSASVMELSRDRVVLFNFLARLEVYPVRFRPGVEPQANLFHWSPREQSPRIETIDIPGFESRSGMRVDYVLLWGSLDAAAPGLKEQFASAVRPFHEVYASPDGVATLYQRNGGGNAVCESAGGKP